MRRLILIAGLLPLLAGVQPARAQTVPGLRVPAGFEVTEFADSRLANDIFCMTLDPRGRVVVSGRGYLRLLVDDDNDGKADRAIQVAAGPKDGAQGILWEGSTLYVTGDGGLRRYHVTGDHADGPSELIRAMKTGGEHTAHALRRGPDGWLYLLCGNFTGIDRSFAQLATSPVKEPVAGCVLRFTPDLKASEIVADGYRNPYGMDFNSDGDLFTFDSDNERCVSLPWYESTRLYQVLPGGHYGWQAPQRAQTWRMPPYFCDVVAPVDTFGRGSPTGVACYRHTQFPEHYRGGLFLLDWTFGKVYFVKLQRSGSSYTCRKEVFLESVGDNGFAPTAVVVHPTTGDLFVAIGGRGTRGAVYRVRYPKGRVGVKAADVAALQPKRRTLSWQGSLQEGLPAQAEAGDAPTRLHALLGMRRFQEHFTRHDLQRVVRANWDYPDRYIRKAAADLIALLDARARRALHRQARTPLQETTFGLATFSTDPEDTITRACKILAPAETPPEPRLISVRLLQQALGGLMARKAAGTVWEGYTAQKTLKLRPDLVHTLRATLRRAFPAGDSNVNRELSRTLAMLEDDAPADLVKVAARFTPTSDPIEDIHYLIVLACLRAPRSAAITAKTAGALLALDRKIGERHGNRDRHWPLRVAELHAELTRKDPGLDAALLRHPDFGRADHGLFALSPGFDRKRAAEVFLKRARQDENFAWNAGLLEIVSALPEERSLPVFRSLWGKAGLDADLLPFLARHPQATDREKFIQGLASPQVPLIRLSLDALQKLPPQKSDVEILALIRALGNLPDGPEGKQLRGAVAAYLGRITGQSRLGANRQAWTAWFSKAYPGLAVRLTNPDGVDVAGWEKRLAKVDWSRGDAARGLAVFTKASCAACHTGTQALGPDLSGVAGRFSRADLFTAILQPSKDVSPRYQTTMIETTQGKIYQGFIIYEAVDGMILQTGPAVTVRVAGSQIASRRVTPASLMPAGLLDATSDLDIADLYAYLKSLGVRGAEMNGASGRCNLGEINMRRSLGVVLALAASLLGWHVPAAAEVKTGKDLPVLFQDNFDKGADHWQPTDAAAWKVVAERGGNKVYSQFKMSNYKPPFRSPLNIALLKNHDVSDFILEAKVQSTGKDGPHRDMCLFFDYQDPAHFYYVHIAKRADDHANQIFIVNGAPRLKISTKTTPGTPWDDQWHRVKIVRTVGDGKIEVYFDDMKTPAMTAQDRTFTHGRVGLGSFDDSGNWDDIKLRGLRAASK